MPVWFLYVIIWLTTFRVTRLIIQDTFPPVAWPRQKILDWLKPDYEEFFRTHDVNEEPPKAHLGAFGRSLHYLGTCPWCMSVWVGAGVVWIFTLYVSVPLPFVAWITASAVTGLIAKNLDPDD